MALPRPLARWVLLPLQERLRGRCTLGFLRWMRRNDRLSGPNLQELHDQLLVAHLRRAAQRVPFYRERVDADLIRGPEDLHRFPLLDRQTVREAGPDLVADGAAGRVFTMATGGSCGEPLRFFTDPRRESSQLACKLRARRWWDLPPGQRETDFWGSPIELGQNGRLRALAQSLQGFQLLSAFDLNDQTMGSFRKRLGQGRCDIVYGYPSVMARYAHFLRDRGETLGNEPLRLTICTAETLLDADRALIESVFQTPLANEYGCRDGGLVAHESPSGFHLMHDAVHVELLDSAGDPVAPGESGEVVLTNLHSGAAPLIRYRVGDRARLDPEPPRGPLPHPRLLAIEGRIADSLVKDDGSRVHGLAVIYVLRALPGVRAFRCLQDRVGELTVELVAGPNFQTDSAPALIQQGVRQALGPQTEVDLRLLDTLPPHASGKHHHVICNVP